MNLFHLKQKAPERLNKLYYSLLLLLTVYMNRNVNDVYITLACLDFSWDFLKPYHLSNIKHCCCFLTGLVLAFLLFLAILCKWILNYRKNRSSGIVLVCFFNKVFKKVCLIFKCTVQMFCQEL